MSDTIRKTRPNWESLDTNHDGKKWYKPVASFKRALKAQRRARERVGVQRLLAERTEVLPVFPKTDEWEWW